MTRLARTIRPHGQSIRRANAEDSRYQDVLEARHQKQGRVLKVACCKLAIVVLGVISLRRRVPAAKFIKIFADAECPDSPSLCSDPIVGPHLHRARYQHLTNDAGQDLLGHETGGWPLWIYSRERKSAAHYEELGLDHA